jgi:hypothetical protein
MAAFNTSSVVLQKDNNQKNATAGNFMNAGGMI